MFRLFHRHVDALQLGDVFADRYVVVKKLGWGHFSTVWMARDDRRDSPTAPKVTQRVNNFLVLEPRLATIQRRLTLATVP